jgi:hypothetical protein
MMFKRGIATVRFCRRSSVSNDETASAAERHHPKPAEPEPNRQYDQRRTDGEASDHGCDGTD